MKRILFALLLLPGGLLGACAGKPPGRPSTWAAIEQPSPGAGAEPIGGYDSGCLRAGMRLPPDPALVVTHPERRRDYGHPDLLGFIAGLSHALVAQDAGPLRVGDLGQPRGGPLPSSHASHQIGLDVDLEYGAAGPARSVLTRDRLRLDPRAWGPAQVVRLRAAAYDPGTARIFVHPTIKVRLCKTLVEPLDWLAKLRPWPGHDDHFHVRLHCPAGAPLCREQPAPPWGSGCYEAQEAQRKLLAKPVADEGAASSAGEAPPRARAEREYDLPAECAGVLKD